MRRVPCVVISIVLASLIPILSVAQEESAGATGRKKPNVVLVLTDDQGYGDLSCHGNPILKTPHMDALHAAGVRLTDFHVDPTCSPSRAALMTGRYAHRVRTWHTMMSGNVPRKDEVFMPEVFKRAGYRTGHFGKWHLGGNYPFRPIDRGFDEWLGQGDGGTGTTADYWGNDRVNDVYIRNGEFTDPIPGYATDVFFDEAMRFIKDNQEDPFFVYLATFAPHYPRSLPDEPWAKAYRGKTDIDSADFLSAVARIDYNLGRLRAQIEELGLTDDTIFIFMGDNGSKGGGPVFNAGMRGEKGEVYDGGHRAPCFLYWPNGGLAGGRDIATLTAHIDLFPTLIDLCGLPSPEDVAFDGRTLKPLFVDPEAPWPERSLVVELQRTIRRSMKWFRTALLTEQWRYLDGKELYDIQADPAQEHNIVVERPDVAWKLRAEVARYMRSVQPGDRDFPWVIVGTEHQEEIVLTGSEFRPIKRDGGCAWNQADVASGLEVFGYAEIEVAKTGQYRFELRRWPREVNAPITGVPEWQKGEDVDAYLNDGPLDGLLYGNEFKSLPVKTMQLNVGKRRRRAEVGPEDVEKSFVLSMRAGPVRIRTVMLDAQGERLTEAFYVYIKPVAE